MNFDSWLQKKADSDTSRFEKEVLQYPRHNKMDHLAKISK